MSDSKSFMEVIKTMTKHQLPQMKYIKPFKIEEKEIVYSKTGETLGVVHYFDEWRKWVVQFLPGVFCDGECLIEMGEYMMSNISKVDK